MPELTGNSPSHIEAEAQVKYCVADPWKARTRWKPPGRHQLDPALLVPLPPAQPRGKGPGAQHSMKEGYWEYWLKRAELWGRVSPPNPTPVMPTLPYQHRTHSLGLRYCQTPSQSCPEDDHDCYHTHFLFPGPAEHPQTMLSYRVSRAILSPVPCHGLHCGSPMAQPCWAATAPGEQL